MAIRRDEKKNFKKMVLDKYSFHDCKIIISNMSKKKLFGEFGLDFQG